VLTFYRSHLLLVFGESNMKDFTIYLSTAPVLAAVWFSFLAGLLIELNRFFPDALSFPFM
jgi:photosystem I subunit 9